MKNKIIAIVVINIIMVIFYFTTKENYNKVTFQCENGESFRVDVALSHTYLYIDEQKIRLESLPAASGARYGTLDERIIFWNKGNEAFVEQDNVITYGNCISEE